MAIKRTPLYKSEMYLVEDGSNRWVEYERCPGIRYRYLEYGEAERMILNGETVRRAFVAGLSAEGFSRTMADTGEKTRESIRIEGGSLTICVPMIFRESIIHVTALQGMTLDPTEGDLALDASFHPETDVMPNHFLGAINFTGTRFLGGVNVTGSEFSTLIFFEGAEFRSVADFTGSVFFDNAVFRGTQFGGDAIFDRTTFHRAAQFVQVAFEKKTSFEDAVFFENAFFTESRFSGAASMTDAHFGKILYAPQSTFEKGIVFDRSCFCLAVELKDAVIEDELSLTGAQGNVMSLAGARVGGPVRIADTPFAVLDFTDTRFEGDVILFGRRWRESIENIEKAVSGHVEGGAVGAVFGGEEWCASGDRKTWADRRREEVETLAAMHRDRGRIVDLVGLEGIEATGHFRSDFSYLAPLSREFPVLDSHRRALKNNDPEGSEGNRTAWNRAEREYAWLGDQYHRQGRTKDEKAARLWQNECRIRGLSGFKRRLFKMYKQDVKRKRDRKRNKDKENNRTDDTPSGPDDE